MCDKEAKAEVKEAEGKITAAKDDALENQRYRDARQVLESAQKGLNSAQICLESTINDFESDTGVLISARNQLAKLMCLDGMWLTIARVSQFKG